MKLFTFFDETKVQKMQMQTQMERERSSANTFDR
jgi:hypothetical protein